MKTRIKSRFLTMARVHLVLVACFPLLLMVMTATGSAQTLGDESFFDDPFWGFFLFGGVYFVVCCGYFIVSVLLAIWVYMDAESRGESGVLWLLVVLIGGVIGLIVWLVVRPPELGPYMGANYYRPHQGYHPYYHQPPPHYAPPPGYYAKLPYQESPPYYSDEQYRSQYEDEQYRGQYEDEHGKKSSEKEKEHPPY